jgi:hypothetical protein
MAKNEDEQPDVVRGLQIVFQRDLDYLDSLNTSVVSSMDISNVRRLTLKYGMPRKVDKLNIDEIIGILQGVVLKKFEKVTYVAMDRAGELDTGRIPIRKKSARETLPEELE